MCLEGLDKMLKTGWRRCSSPVRGDIGPGSSGLKRSQMHDLMSNVPHRQRTLDGV